MGRPQQITDEELLEIAREIFMEQGFGVATQVIAKQAGLSQPAIFKRFRTKEELFLAALAPPPRLQVQDWMDERPVPGDFQPQLRQLLGKLWETLEWVIPRMMTLAHSPVTHEKIFKRYKVPPLFQLVFQNIPGFFERAKNNGQIREDLNLLDLSQSVLGTLQGRSILTAGVHAINKTQDVDGFAVPGLFGEEQNNSYLDSTCDLLWRGIKQEGDAQ